MTKHIKKEYVDILSELYPTQIPISEIAEKMKLSSNTVEVYARKLGLSRPKPEPWNALSEKDERLILNMYEYGDFDELSKLVGRSKHTISEWVRKRGLRREVNDKRNGNISILLNKSLQSFYWLGLLASDGYISKDGHLMFSQGEKDKDIVYSLAEYLNSKVYIFDVESGYNLTKRVIYRVNIKDYNIGKSIRNMWGLSDTDQKTYSSISPNFIKTKEQAMAFLIGFFDGDGHLDKRGYGKIEVHSNWLQFLNSLCELVELDYEGKINKRGFAWIYINKSFMIILKKFIDDNNLTYNRRKWFINS
jgi:DNA-binding transcriptional regulator WhiA